MKTVMYYLQNTDLNEVLDIIANDLMKDTIALLEMKDRTIEDIRTRYKDTISESIDELLKLEMIPTDRWVLYLCDCADHGDIDRQLYLCDVNEIRENIDASSYSFISADWQETLGYLVADNKLTQDYITTVLAEYLKEVTYFGSMMEIRMKRIERVKSELDKSMQDIREEHTISAEDVFRKLEEEYGWPHDEEDETQDRLRQAIHEAEHNFNQYCHRRERKRILKSIQTLL